MRRLKSAFETLITEADEGRQIEGEKYCPLFTQCTRPPAHGCESHQDSNLRTQRCTMTCAFKREDVLVPPERAERKGRHSLHMIVALTKTFVV